MHLLFLLIACAAASGATVEDRSKRQLNFGLQSSLGSYLPPNPTPNQPCVAQTIFVPTTIVSQIVVPTIVYNNNVQRVTQTQYSTRIVPSTFVSEVIRTQVVPSIRYETRYVTNTQFRTQTQVVTAPGATNFVTLTQTEARTQFQQQTRYTTRVQQIPSTLVRNVVSTVVIPQNVVRTVVNTQYVTRTQQLPGRTQTIASTAYSTVYSTVQIPGRDVVLTQTVVSTYVRFQTINLPGQTQYITSTAVNVVTSTSFSNVVRYNTQTQYVTSTQVQQIVSTVYRTQQVPQYNTRYVTVPQDITRTQFSTRVVQTTIYDQQVVPSYVNVPGNTQYVTITSTVVRSQQLPGNVETRYVTNTQFAVNYVTSTVYNTQVNTRYATQTVQGQCGGGGYNYNAPAVPFNFGR